MHLSCFFNDTATTEIYTYEHTLSLHDALPIPGLCMAATRRPTQVHDPDAATSSATRARSSASPNGSRRLPLTKKVGVPRTPAVFTSARSRLRMPTVLGDSICVRDRKSTRLNSSH